MNTIEIWTVQMAKWRLAKSQGLFLLDVTAKSGIQQFAPVMSDVLAYKRGALTEEKYTEIYHARMAFTKECYPGIWESLGKIPKMAIACYCPVGQFCHRLLFADLTEEYLKTLGYEVIRHGELTK